MAVMLTAIYVS